MSGPKLQVTKDYGLFEMYDFNRHLRKDHVLEESMEKHGWMPSSPAQVIRNSNGKLKIIKGHRRFDISKRKGLNVWYVIDESNTDMFELEAGQSKWSILDFAQARAEGGDGDCIKLLEFWKKHKLPLGAAASLVGGQSAGSSNKKIEIKTGSFEVGDLKHANQVVRITDRCRELNISFATNSAFVIAVSNSLRIPEFDINLFIHRIDQNGFQMRKRSTVKEYLDEIEAMYNYGAHKNRLSVAFRARDVGKERQRTFGRISPEKKKVKE